MAPQITVLEHAFHFSLPDIPNKTVSLLSKLTFDGGGNVSAKDHINKFWCKCIKHDISDLKVLCRLFAFTFRGRIKHWFESFPAYHIFYWFQFVDEFLDAFEIYDYNQLCEEFQTLLINGDSSSKGFSTRIHHVLCKFNLDDMSFVLNLLYDACIQSYSIANDEAVTNTITQLQEELCSQDERDPSENVEQAREVESIENVLTDNQIGFSSESLYFQSSTIVEEDSMLGQGECPRSPNSFSNQYLNSVIEEDLGDENDLKHSNIPMKLIRDVDLQLEEVTLNPHLQIVPYQHERSDVFHESFELSIVQEANLDDHIMLKNLSPKQSESFKENEEECLENTIVKYHSSRYSFHVLISDSFYSLYPDLFLDSGGFDTLPTVSYSLPPQSNLFDMPKFGETNSKHNTYQVGFDALSLSSLEWKNDMLQDDFTRFIFEKDNALILMEIEYSTLHIRSLISSNFNVYASHFETINLIKGSVQTNNLTDVMNPLMMCSPLIYPFHQSHSLHPNFYDMILEWLEDSYLKNLHNKDKVVLALFLPKYLGSKHHMIFLDPLCEEIDEHLENCQEDGAFRLWLMVMSGPHNIDKFSKLTYTLPCHYDPYHDQIAEWLEDSYIKKFQKNGKVMLALFLNDDDKGKYDIFFYFSIYYHSC
jgi:hypothetical protein